MTRIMSTIGIQSPTSHTLHACCQWSHLSHTLSPNHFVLFSVYLDIVEVNTKRQNFFLIFENDYSNYEY